MYKKVVGKDADEKYINEEISADFIGKYLIDNDTLMQKYIVGKQSIFQKIKKSIQSLFKNKNELNLTKEENKYLEEIYKKVIDTNKNNVLTNTYENDCLNNERYLIKLSNEEYAKLRKEVMRKNSFSKNHFKTSDVDCAFTDKYFYIYNNYGNDNFLPIKKIKIVNNDEKIKYIEREINYDIDRTSKNINSYFKTNEFRERSNNRDNVNDGNKRNGRQISEISNQQSESNSKRNFEESNGDKSIIRYSLSDFNAEETEKRRKTIKNRLLSEEEFDNKNDLFVGFFKESGKYNFFNANNELGFYIDDDFYSQTNFKAELEFRKKSPFVYITYFKTKGNIVSTGNFNASDVFIKSNEFLNSIPREDNNNFAGIKGIEFNLGDKKVLITRTAVADMHAISTNGEMKISIYEIDGKQMTIFSGNQGECYIRNQIKLSDEDMKYVFKYNLTNNVATENKLKEESVKNTITSYKDLSGVAKDFVSKVKEYIDNYGANEGLLKLREIYSIKDEEFSFIVDFLVEKRGYKAEDFDKNLLGIKENALRNNENIL